MVSNLVCYQLVLIALVWVFLLLCWLGPSELAASCPTTPQTLPPPRKRSTGPKPFTGLTRKPYCEACAQAIEPPVNHPLALHRVSSRHGDAVATSTPRTSSVLIPTVAMAAGWV